MTSDREDGLAAPDNDHVKPTQQQRRAFHRRVMSRKPQHRSLSRLVRANAKHLVETGQINNVFPLCAEDHNQIDRACLRSHLQRDLRSHLENAKRKPPSSHYNGPTSRRVDHQDEGRDLAYSDMPLPSDRYRLVRRPTLEREDAFRDASTSSRGRIHVRRAAAADDDDQQVAQLYSAGLLYDSEQDRAGDGFDLNAIPHDEPLYSIRPAKRERRGRSSSKPGGKAPDNRKRRLHVDLSFSDLGNDEALAQYLMALTRPDDDAGGDTDVAATAAAAEVARQPCRGGYADSQPPMRIIYELATSQPHFEVDASQPPDLVRDLLSDYDCFSEADLDDTPSQREVQEEADSSPSDVWVILGEGS
ncbi:hypothetical protein E4U41_006895 [Claviceps citrina]|nr:hypothetical protein E4U41_006895 [Claviceps citrina]